MNRLTDNDKNFGPLTIGQCDRGTKLKMISIGNCGDDTDHYATRLVVYFNRFAMRLMLPNFIKPHKRWVKYSDGGCWQFDPKEYGISLMDGHVSIQYGRQTMDSSSDKSWGFFLPWKEWRMVKMNLYDADGKLFWSGEGDMDINTQIKNENLCPKRKFQFFDFDGEKIVATTHIEERKWHRCSKRWKWLSIFFKPNTEKCLRISFSSDVGKEKGSWKGGIVGTAIKLTHNENHTHAFKRFCEEKSLTYQLPMG